MRRARWMLAMILSTVLIATIMVGWSSEDPVDARVVQVERGDVHRVIGLTGYISYMDESFVLSPTNGIVTQISVESGDRMSEGETLARISSAGSQTAMAIYAAAVDAMNVFEDGYKKPYTAVPTLAIRMEGDKTVRKVLVKEGDTVTVGSPIALISSNQQVVICTVTNADLKTLASGMWAWITTEAAETLGQAYIHSIGEVTTDTLTGLKMAEVTLIPEKHIEMDAAEVVNVDIYLAGSNDVPTLPVEAISDRDTVWWVTDEGRCTEINAEIVMTDEMLAWVNLPEGLKVAVGEFSEGQCIQEVVE